MPRLVFPDLLNAALLTDEERARLAPGQQRALRHARIRQQASAAGFAYTSAPAAIKRLRDAGIPYQDDPTGWMNPSGVWAPAWAVRVASCCSLRELCMARDDEETRAMLLAVIVLEDMR